MGLSLAYDAWLRSGVSGNARNATLLYSSGTHDYADTNYRYAVRPALYSTVINLKKPRISRTFWGYRSRMTPGCVPAVGTLLTMYTFSVRLAAMTSVTLFPAMPCVPRFTCLRKNLLQTIPEFGSFKYDRTDYVMR